MICPFDKETNQFPKKLNDTYEDIDIYISCYNNVQIFYYGKSILEAYVPSLIRGKNMMKAITELDNDIIIEHFENDSEVYFKFHSKHMEHLEQILKPKISGASISPFSSKNLPQNKSYTIPDEELQRYKIIVSKIPRERILDITHITNKYLKSLAGRKRKWEDIRYDMRLKALKGKEYIHSIGRWDDYLRYLETRLKENIFDEKDS